MLRAAKRSRWKDRIGRNVKKKQSTYRTPGVLNAATGGTIT